MKDLYSGTRGMMDACAFYSRVSQDWPNMMEILLTSESLQACLILGKGSMLSSRLHMWCRATHIKAFEI